MYEFYSDPAYFDMWAIKKTTDKHLTDAIHVGTRREAEDVANALNTVENAKLWREALLEAWRNDHRAVMTHLLETGF